MLLNIKDRILIPQIMPPTGTFMEFNLKKSILNKINITEEDKEKYKIETNKEAMSITWNVEIDLKEPLDVNFSEEELAYLRNACEQLSETAHPDDVWVVVEKIYNSK
jgi:hypothetical protein